jgi:hypothetical protein
MNQETPITDPQTSIQTPKNKQKIRLIFPYSENAEVKKLGAKWDMEKKIWYYPSLNGELPEPLKKYKANKVFIEYDDKEFYKPLLKSMKFDKNEKCWLVNEEDFNKFLTLNDED